MGTVGTDKPPPLFVFQLVRIVLWLRDNRTVPLSRIGGRVPATVFSYLPNSQDKELLLCPHFVSYARIITHRNEYIHQKKPTNRKMEKISLAGISPIANMV